MPPSSSVTRPLGVRFTLDPWLCVPPSRVFCLYRKEILTSPAQPTCQGCTGRWLEEIVTKKGPESFKAVECHQQSREEFFETPRLIHRIARRDKNGQANGLRTIY